MATRFYFHAANSGVSGTLPSTEQSTLTADASADAGSVNRSMSTTIGTSAATLTTTSIANTTQHAYYYTKFISPLIYQTSVAANTWVYAFSAKENVANNNFPVNANNKSVYINIYVWRPGNGNKVGTIIDGTTAATVDEASINVDQFHIVNVTGSAVNNVQNGDVIICEIWFQCTQSVTAQTGTQTFTYDGGTVYTENQTSATNAASYLETPENLTLTLINQTVLVEWEEA